MLRLVGAGEFIRNLRVEAGYSLKDIVKLTNKKYQMIWQYENDRLSTPLSYVIFICRLTGHSEKQICNLLEGKKVGKKTENYLKYLSVQNRRLKKGDITQEHYRKDIKKYQKINEIPEKINLFGTTLLTKIKKVKITQQDIWEFIQENKNRTREEIFSQPTNKVLEIITEFNQRR